MDAAGAAAQAGGGDACCFVCLEDRGSLHNPCGCSLQVHARCMAQLLARTPSHATACPVCREPYHVVRRHCKLSRLVCSLAALFGAAVCANLGIGLLIYYCAGSGGRAQGIFLAVGGVLLGAAVCLSMCWVSLAHAPPCLLYTCGAAGGGGIVLWYV